MRRTARLRSLFEGEARSPRAEPNASPDSLPDSRVGQPAAPGEAAAKLWKSIYLPNLCLEALTEDPNRVCLVSETSGRKSLVVAASAVALRAGIRPGMSVNAAFALVPNLVVIPRDTEREQSALRWVARALMAFSPAVSIVEPASLLLEISGSLRYFGGLDLLEAGLDTCIAQTGYTHVAACAPTPRAAQWLATAGTRATVQNLAELMSVLAPLPVACLGWPEKECCVLDQMGIETLGDCFRLPRHGFARRFGRHRLRELDEGLGRVAQALLVYNPPVDFGECIEPDAEIDDSVTVLKWVTPVLDRLEIFLKQHQAGVSELRLKLGHSRQADTCLKVGLLQPATRAHTLSELLEIRLEHTGLAACVTRIEVQADIRQCYVPEQVSLFAGWQAGRDESVPELVQRLCSRLGEASVHRVGFVAEHRPEWAWQSFAGPAISAAGQADDRQEASASYSGMRPVWMLESPVALTESAAGPAYRGPLCLESGPERIETGWWDGSDIRRDYFLASNSMGERLWVYRELRSGCWYLHGFFG